MFQEQALRWVTLYGPIALVALAGLNRVGMPTWITVVLITAGGLARAGQLDLVAAVGSSVLGLVVGDALCFFIGGHSFARLVGRFGQSGVLRQAMGLLDRSSLAAIFLSRFLILPLTMPVNLLAASTHVRLPLFLLLAVVGDSLFVAIYFGLGYAFGGSWPAVLAALRSQHGWVWGLLGVALVLALVGAVVARRRGSTVWRRARSALWRKQ